MNKKILNTLSSLLALACLPMVAHAQTGYNGDNDGDWNTPGTWNPVGTPGTGGTGGNVGDSAFIGTQGGNNITLNTDAGTLGSTFLYRTAVTTLTLNSGANLNSTLFQIERGTATVNTGATLTAPSYIAFGNGAPNSTVNTLSINGGTVNTGIVYFGALEGGGTGVTTKLEVLNGGSFTSTGQVIFNSNNGGISDFKVTSGTAEATTFQFDGGGDSAKTGLVARSVTVNGGELTVTGAAATSFDFGSLSSSQAYLDYNGGSVVWSAIADSIEFTTFKNDVYAVALSFGYLKSLTSGYNNTQLLDGLTYQDGIGAVLAIPEISSASALMGLTMGMIVFITRRKRSH